MPTDRRLRGMPTPDHVAYAIVAACRETDDDPIAVIRGLIYGHARHYALHALLHVFPECPRVMACKLTGAPEPKAFWNNTKSKIGDPLKPRAKWWNPVAYDRVIAAIYSVAIGPSRALIVREVHEFPKAPVRRASRKFRLVDRIQIPRRRPVLDYTNVTAELCGDPPLARSALGQRLGLS